MVWGGFNSIAASRLARHQRGDMSGCALSQCIEVVAAFEKGNDTAIAMTICEITKCLGQPNEILLVPVEIGQRVVAAERQIFIDIHAAYFTQQQLLSI